jgi:fatty-acyl-CoA synthase
VLSLNSRIEAAASRGGAVTFLTGPQPERVPWSQFHDEARAMAAALQARGVGPGSHVGILGPTTRPLVTAIQAVWQAGGTLVVLPLPMRLGSIEEFVQQTRARARAADVSLLVVDEDLAGFMGEPGLGDPPVVLLGDLLRGERGWRYERPKDDPSRLAVLQFTSGSTADPKGVMLPHETICNNLDAAGVAAQLDPEQDVLVSWLPLYHDMGLIGLLTLPMITGTDLVLAAPQDFLAGPSRWMEWMSAFGGTATAGPNFSYALAARALGRLDNLDLSRWRIALNGAEPVDPATVGSFVEAGARHGLRPEAVFPAFGMAELGIAGAFPIPGRGLVTDSVDLRVLDTDRYAAPTDPHDEGCRSFALLGRPVPGLEFRITDPATGDVMREREVGELLIKGTSVTPGYYRRPDATAATIRNGWLHTGDLAYLVGGELVVCGRIKDIIIVGGRNVFPEDVERAAGGVDGVRPGNVIAFGVSGRRGREALVVVAETKEADPGDLRTQVSRRVVDAVGLPPQEIVLVAPGTLPKTSSGKLQRALCRTRYLDEQLQLVG